MSVFRWQRKKLSECLQMAAEELGFSELTPEQAVVVENFVRGRDGPSLSAMAFYQFCLTDCREATVEP